MPSTATITTFHTFTANTKARASQVNTNFSNFRGHSIPVNTDTATASDNTHDLGASDHYWRNAYLASVDFRTSTTTATLILKGDTSATNGSFLFQIEGVTKAEIGSGGIDGQYMKATSIPYSSMVYNPQLIWQEFQANGTWTCPSGVDAIIFEMCGGGGGGGTTKGGGGAGAPLVMGFAAVTPGQAYSITAGRGGYGGGTGSNPGEVAGGDGVASSIAGVASAIGGAGGQTGNSGATGTAGRGGIPAMGGSAGGCGSAYLLTVFGHQTSFPAAGQSGALSGHAGGAAGTNGGGGGAGPYGVGAVGGDGASSAGASAAAGSGAGGGGGGLSSANGGDGGSGRVRIGYVRYR